MGRTSRRRLRRGSVWAGIRDERLDIQSVTTMRDDDSSELNCRGDSMWTILDMIAGDVVDDVVGRCLSTDCLR